MNKTVQTILPIRNHVIAASSVVLARSPRHRGTYDY